MLQYCYLNKKAEKLSSHIGIQSPKSATILCFDSSVPYFDENVNGSSEISSQIDGLRMQETSLTDQIGAVLNNKSQDLFSVPELQFSQGLNNLDSDIIRTSKEIVNSNLQIGESEYEDFVEKVFGGTYVQFLAAEERQRRETQYLPNGIKFANGEGI